MKLENGTKLPIQYRNCKIERNADAVGENTAVINEDARSVRLSFSSEAPVLREFGNEVLVHEKRAVRLTRLNTSAPLLLDHDTRNQIGVVDYATIGNGRGEAVVRFSKSAKGEEVWNDVRDGIRSLVSVGYRIHKTEVNNRDADIPTVRVTDWEPYEVSIVSVPADISVGVGRSDDHNQWPVEVRMDEQPAATNPNQMNEPTTTISATEPVYKAGNQEFRSYADYAAQIKQTGEIMAAKPADMADAISRNLTPTEFAQDYTKRNPPAPLAAANNTIGMTRKETETFSLRKAICDIATTGELRGFEKEINDEVFKSLTEERRRNFKQGTILLPDDMFQRAQNVTTATAGGFTVQDNLGALIPLLRNQTALDKLGITRLTGLTGNILFPVHASGTTAYWVSETGALTDSESTFAQKAMTPHRVGATVPYSTQFLAQSSLSVEAFLRQDLMATIDRAVDLAGLEGSGADGQPLGVKNISGINSTVTFGGAATWADIVEFETGIAADNADVGSMAFALSAATVGKWKSILRDSVAGSAYLIGDSGLVNGYPYVRTNQITGSIGFFGVWSELLYGEWGMEVIVDPYALKKSGQVEVTVNKLCDFLVRQPLAFNVSTDSAAQ